MKKKYRVITREYLGSGVDSINIGNITSSRFFDFSDELLAKQFFYKEIGSFLYAIEDIEDIFKLESKNKKQLDFFCPGFVRRFILIYL